MTTATPTRITVRDAADASANIIWNLEDRLRIAHGENLALRSQLAEHGINAPAPDGVISLTRMRRLEDIMDLARHYLRHGTPQLRAELTQAISDAGRLP